MEIENIAQELGMPVPAFVTRYVRAMPGEETSILHSDGDRCPFLSWDSDRGFRTVYPFRPQACRNWMASLSRPECRQGLARLKAGGILLPQELYSSSREVKKLYSILEERS